MSKNKRVVVVGAGCIGLSIAKEISNIGIETIVLERSKYPGSGNTSRNSSVIHAGIYICNKIILII